MVACVCIQGMIIRVGEIIPEMRTAYFECLSCNWNTSVVIEDGVIPEPTECKNCAARYTMQIVRCTCSACVLFGCCCVFWCVLAHHSPATLASTPRTRTHMRVQHM